MPFTPFHFGPGLLGKGLAPRAFSWAAFAITNVVIDLESGYYLLRQDYPVHRHLHTFLGAAIVAVVVAAVLIPLARRWRAASLPILYAEISALGIATGALAGGLTHPVLDGIMHADIEPLQPWSAGNPFRDVVGFEALHQLCLVAGCVGVLLIALRWRRG